MVGDRKERSECDRRNNRLELPPCGMEVAAILNQLLSGALFDSFLSFLFLVLVANTLPQGNKHQGTALSLLVSLYSVTENSSLIKFSLNNPNLRVSFFPYTVDPDV